MRLTLVVISSLLLSSWQSFAKPADVNILFIPPGTTNYWHDVTVPMPPVAKQLGLNLTIKPHDNIDTSNYEEQVLKLIRSATDVDWIIWSQRREATEKILQELEHRNIKSIDITSGLFDDVHAKIGYPQEKYKHWMAQVVTDEYQGGQRLAKELIQLKRSQTDKKQISLVGLAGNKRVAATIRSVNGLHKVVNQDPQAKVLQVVHTGWMEEHGQQKTEQLYLRYKQFDVIWAANTNISIGAVKHLRKINFAENHRPVVANFGWSKATFAALASNELAFSLGGNHLNGVWALIVIHDIIHGVKPAPQPAYTMLKAPYFKVTKANLKQVKPYFSAKPWATANIKQFSKLYNPKLRHYNFDFSLLLNKSK